MEVARQSVEILGRRLNVADRKFKNLEDFTLEEIKNIHKQLEGRQWDEFEMKEAITSFGCRFMEALRIIETLNEVVMTLKESTEAGGSTSPDNDREAWLQVLKPPNPVALGGFHKV